MNKQSNSTDKERIKIVDHLNKVIGNYILTKQVEQSIYNYIIVVAKGKNIQRRWNNPVFKNLYHSKVISIYSNLKKDSYIKNETFLDRLIDGSIKPSDVGKLSVYDTFPDNWKEQLNAKSKRD